jgi:aspartate/methionine/tyrosine aminotransferase
MKKPSKRIAGRAERVTPFYVMELLEEARVAITPGYDFGSFRAGQYVRFSYANSQDML